MSFWKKVKSWLFDTTSIREEFAKILEEDKKLTEAQKSKKKSNPRRKKEQ